MKRPEVRVLVVLLAVLIVGGLWAPRLLQPQAISSILLWIPLIAVIAVGQMFVIVSRGVDVSVGSIVGFAGMASGLVFKGQPGAPVWLGLVVAVFVGALCGLLNGFLIAQIRIPPIVATLGTMSALRGGTYLLGHGDQIDSNYIPDALTRWSFEGPFHVGGVTVPWIISFAVVATIWGGWVAHYRRFGRDVFAIGANPEAAHLRGVPVKARLLGTYTLCGALAGLAGLLYMSRYGFVNPATAGQGMELTVIAAAVIGGCDVRGGQGTVIGVFLGCVLLGVINVALAVLGIAADWQTLAYGVVIVASLATSAVVNRKEARA